MAFPGKQYPSGTVFLSGLCRRGFDLCEQRQSGPECGVWVTFGERSNFLGTAWAWFLPDHEFSWRIKKVASVQERVIDIVAEQLGVDKEKVTPETSFVNDLGADSLDTVELVMELEEEFDITIPDDAAEKIQTVGQAVQYIENSQS